MMTVRMGSRYNSISNDELSEAIDWLKTWGFLDDEKNIAIAYGDDEIINQLRIGRVSDGLYVWNGIEVVRDNDIPACMLLIVVSNANGSLEKIILWESMLDDEELFVRCEERQYRIREQKDKLPGPSMSFLTITTMMLETILD